MPTKRKKKAAAPRRKKPGKGLVIKVTLPAHVSLQGPELGALTAAQRLDLAALGSKRTSAVPAWASDDKTWRKALRHVSPRWKRYEHPYAAVALVYLRMGGLPRSAAHGGAGHHHHEERARRVVRPQQHGGVAVEPVELDDLGYADNGTYYGVGEPLWRVTSEHPYFDKVVRARTAAAARSQVMSRFQH